MCNYCKSLVKFWLVSFFFLFQLNVYSENKLELNTSSGVAIFPETPSNSNQKFKLITPQIQTKLGSKEVLKRLKQGNQRYVNNKSTIFNQRAISSTASRVGQAPYAIVFSCIDSRSVPEVIFDQPVGALFVSRIAGNVLSPDVIGGVEFATQYAGTKLIVIMGHTRCGAVQGACAGVKKPNNLKTLLKRIGPAVKTVQKQSRAPLKCEDYDVVNQIAKRNVLNQLKVLYQKSPATKRLIQSGQVMVVGAMHDMDTGTVTFYEI